MKTNTLFVLLFILACQVNAQTSETCPCKNELKLDVFHLTSISTVKVEYEYLLNNRSSLGAVASYRFNSWSIFHNSSGFSEMQLLGTYRFYFAKKTASGFFLEGNMGLINWLGWNVHFSYLPWGGGPSWSTRDKVMYGFGMGGAFGWKFFMPKSNTVLDIFAGLGKVIGHDQAYLRTGVSVGKRF